jgi:hypothetical protein
MPEGVAALVERLKMGAICALDGCGKELRKGNISGYCAKHHQKSSRWLSGLPERRAKSRLRQASKYLVRTYGITLEQKLALLQAQGGKCAICGQSTTNGRGWAMDHCHTTGKLRGVLCNSCNVGIGVFSEDTGRLLAAIGYLKEHA